MPESIATQASVADGVTNVDLKKLEADLAWTSEPRLKLDPLTSLRFFAWAGIVLLHVFPHLNFPMTRPQALLMAQGVSFFFVLSGFVLTYVYRDLSRPADLKAFFLARFARVWPMHVACILLGLFMLNSHYWEEITSSSGKILLAQLAMIHAWIPDRNYYYSLDDASWSISTECGFYLFFPFLLRRRPLGWTAKLLLSLVIATIFALLVGPHECRFATGICPLGRLQEFVLGMSVCALWLKTHSKIKLKPLTGSLIEVGFLVLVAMYLFFVWQKEPIFPPPNNQGTIVDCARCWFMVGGNAPIYAAMIFLVATEQGFISKALKHPWLVWLGEISYSVYLVHFILVQYIDHHKIAVKQFDHWTALVTFLIAVLGLSNLMFLVVERPCRNWLRTLPQFFSGRQRPPRFDLTGPALMRSLPKCALAVVVVLFLTTVHLKLEAVEAAAFPYKTLALPGAIRFGDNIVLHSIQAGIGEAGMKIRLGFRGERRSHAKQFVAVHLIGENGKLLTSRDYAFQWNILPGPTNRSDVIEFRKEECSNAQALGILMYRDVQSNVLDVDSGDRDWQGHRLIISLSATRPIIEDKTTTTIIRARDKISVDEQNKH